MAVILDKVIMVMSSYLTVSMLRRKIITLDGITAVMASCLTVIVPSWNGIAVILDSVFTVMAS